MLYVRTPLQGNEFRVCNEITDEVVAIFGKIINKNYRHGESTNY